MKLPQIDDYQSLFSNNTPLLDVRAPIEYRHGAMPNSINLPLMNDEERHAVGIEYKSQGQDAAIKLGEKLISGDTKYQRVHQWQNYVKNNPHGALYCFRGGLRSRIAQQWIYDDSGIIFPRIKGGHKALRRYLIDQLDLSIQNIHFTLLSGRTGSGKTRLLNQLTDKIDLENIYHHRGSAFGAHVTPQPTQIDIENSLSSQLLRVRLASIRKLLLEDESANIGSRRLPNNLIIKMKQSPLILLETPTDERVNTIFDEYISQSLFRHIQHNNEDRGFDIWVDYLQFAFQKIKKRLGGTRYKALNNLFEYAIEKHRHEGKPEHHKLWIQNLVTNYYDPMYDYQLGKKSDRIIFIGDSQSIKEYWENEMNT